MRDWDVEAILGVLAAVLIISAIGTLLHLLFMARSPRTPHQAHELYLELRDAEIARFEKNMKGENK